MFTPRGLSLGTRCNCRGRGLIARWQRRDGLAAPAPRHFCLPPAGNERGDGGQGLWADRLQEAAAGGVLQAG